MAAGQIGQIRKVRVRGTMVRDVAEALRTQILAGSYRPGDKLPSEAQLTAAHGVSRTVIREAISSLRADGLVEPRQGAGVFVQEPMPTAQHPFQHVDYQKVSNVLEILELRAPVEIEAASIAAQRCSPAQEERLLICLSALEERAGSGKSTVEADFALHLAIAEATNNRRYPEFLQMMGPHIIPRAALGMSDATASTVIDLTRLNAEHARIVDAIIDRDPEGAREAMRVHLIGGRQRYRMMLRLQDGHNISVD